MLILPIKKKWFDMIKSGEKIRRGNLGKIPWNKGIKNCFSKETIQKMSKNRKGIKVSNETKEKLRQQKLGNKNPMFGKKPANIKKIAQYDLNNNLIKIWDDMTQPSKELKIIRTNIVKCCKNERKSAGNYVWKYIDIM